MAAQTHNAYNQSGFSQLLIILVVLVALVATTIAIRHTQDLHSQAQVFPATAPCKVEPCTATNMDDSPGFVFNLALTGKGQAINDGGTSADAFISKVRKSGLGSGISNDDIAAIYNVSLADIKVNPVLLFAFWGTEQGFNPAARDYAFSCQPASQQESWQKNFNVQLHCAVDTISTEMDHFAIYKQFKHYPVTMDDYANPTGNTCLYTDATLYALEVYGPICHKHDNNEAFRTNLTNYYRQITQ